MTRPAVLFLLLCCAAAPGGAAACPDPEAEPVERHQLTGRDLWRPDRFSVSAGGEIDLWGCGGIGWGLVRAAPDFVFELTRLRRYRRLHLRANAECDTVLLVRDPAGQWFFDDDSGVGHTASLSLADPVDGAYAVWVGAFRSAGCVAQLTLESF